MFQLSRRSMNRLNTVKAPLRLVVLRAIQISEVDFMVLEGARTVARQHQLYGQGRTAAELQRVGVNPALARPSERKVTWTLNSNHFADEADGLGRAVDLVPYPVDWNDLRKFDAIAKSMFAAAEELGVGIRWGADWDQDGNYRERGESDSPHFELAPGGA